MNHRFDIDTPTVAVGAFVLLAFLWGTSFVAIEVGLHTVPPVLFAAMRYDVAGVIVLAYAARTTDRWWPQTRDELLSIAVTGVFVIAAYHGLLYLGELHVSGAVAAVIVSLTPVLTAAVASTLLDDEHLTALGVMGLGFGLAGVFVIARPTPSSLASSSLAGMVLVLFGTVCFALGSVLTRPLDRTLPTAARTGWAMLLGAYLLHVLSALRGESIASVHLTPAAVGSYLYLTVVSGAAAYLLYFELLDHVGPTEINLVGYLEPVAATTMSWLLLGDLVDSRTMVGFVVIFAGFALLKGRSIRELGARR